MTSSIKKKASIYLKKRDKGGLRGEYCIGMQGFRSVASELQIINITKEGMDASNENGTPVDDPDFSKMLKCRRLVMCRDRVEATIDDEVDDSQNPRQSHGVTYILSGLTSDAKKTFTVKNIVAALSEYKRTELLEIKNLTIKVTDGTITESVTPVKYKGDKVVHRITLPEQNEDISNRGFGEVTATLYYHAPGEGSKIAVTVRGEPIYLDLCQKMEDFNKYPWNSKMVEGTIEYPRLTKQPSRVEIERDTFYDAFIKMVLILEEEVKKKVKEIESKKQSKQDDKLLNKLENVFVEIRREINLNFFESEKNSVSKGPLAKIQAFPDEINVEALSKKHFM